MAEGNVWMVNAKISGQTLSLSAQLLQMLVLARLHFSLSPIHEQILSLGGGKQTFHVD